MADAYGQRIKYKQDMPPPGGYKDFIWHRTFPKTWATASKLFGGFIVAFSFGIFYVRNFRRKIMMMEIDHQDAKIALEPFVLAERDRIWLRYLRKMREAETELMKDVPGWQAGTWYGEPVYFTVGDKWQDPNEFEMFAHARYMDGRWITRFKLHDGWAGPHWWDKYLPEWLLERMV